MKRYWQAFLDKVYGPETCPSGKRLWAHDGYGSRVGIPDVYGLNCDGCNKRFYDACAAREAAELIRAEKARLQELRTAFRLALQDFREELSHPVKPPTAP